VLKQIEGSRAVAEAVAMCRPQVICAYPITPQTHIVEALGALVKKGELNAGFLNVESEFAAMSAVIGASAAGARTYTATASQGLLYMSEAVYNAAGLGLPVVMTVANRAIGAPINIWNDHSDSMSQRDAGWIQLYAETNQEAADLHIQAFRIAEELSNPVMVCMDGFLLTHASERVDVPGQDEVDAFLPSYEPRQVLDPRDPVSIGAMVGPEAFTEVRFLAAERMRQALDLIPQVAADFERQFGRSSGGLVRPYRTDDAELIVIALGSVLGTIKDTIDELRDDGIRAGALGITSFRPFPVEAVRAALDGDRRLRRLVVIERALAPGSGGIVTADLRTALAAADGRAPRAADAIISTVVAGLGGRPVTRKSLRTMLLDAENGKLPPFSFLDLRTELAEAELARMRASRRSGPSAENILRHLSVTAPGALD
jgi:pyruvate ferredoxin oxidoreductase alpha subunit